MTDATSPDPLVPIDDESLPEMDIQAHVRMFNRVVKTAEWFVAHVLILLVALYFLAIGGQPGVGFFLIFCSISLLIFGTLRRSSIRDDVAVGLQAGPTAPDYKTQDPRE